MQLFGLVNTMLAHDRITAERDLSIARYAVIPLSPNSGALSKVNRLSAAVHPPKVVPNIRAATMFHLLPFTNSCCAGSYPVYWCTGVSLFMWWCADSVHLCRLDWMGAKHGHPARAHT